jgi:hypothetical protein
MYDVRRQPDHRPFVGLIITLGVAAPALLVATLAARSDQQIDYLLPLLVLSAFAIFLIVMIDLCCGLALFIIAAGLSPKMPGLGYNNLRVEDGIFVIVLAVWLIRCFRLGQLPRPRTPITAPFIAVTLMGVVSTAWGYSHGTIPDLAYSILMQIKRVEYFLIFWLVATSVNSPQWLRTLILVFVVSGALVVVYGLYNRQETGYLKYAATRIAIQGENYNTLSGYLIVCLGLGIGAYMEFKQQMVRLLILGSLLLTLAGLLFAFSREGLVMLLGSVAVLLTTRHRRFVLAAIILLAPAMLWGPVRAHIQETATKIVEAPSGDIGNNSLTARLNSWTIYWRWVVVRHPLIGNGVGSVPLSVDNEYLLRVCEGGVVGLGLFLWGLAAIAQQVRRLRTSETNPHCQLLQTALFAAIVGLLIQGLAAASFTTIRTMEPFWFMLGLGSAALALAQEQSAGGPEAAALRDRWCARSA